MSHVMALFTNDEFLGSPDQAHPRNSHASSHVRTSWTGLGLAVITAASFGLSGAVVKGMLAAGWSPGAAVTARIGIAALVLAIPTAVSLRGRWHLVVANRWSILAFGVLAVAGCQLFYFNAVARMDVGVALLVEFTSPGAVIVWLWLRHGQRPGVRTLVGAAIAGVGLVTMLGLLPGVSDSVVVDLIGVLWALGAMVGAATFFVMSASVDDRLPPVALAATGLAVGALTLLGAGTVGWLEFSASTEPVSYDIGTVAWWVPVLVLGLICAALPYATGIAAVRRLGSRLAAFVALLEVVAALLFAWLLLGEWPLPLQFLGGVLILLGVILVKLGERVSAVAA
jgi:drug/metabolite transporter (DMT)-like permease